MIIPDSYFMIHDSKILFHFLLHCPRKSRHLFPPQLHLSRGLGIEMIVPRLSIKQFTRFCDFNSLKDGFSHRFATLDANIRMNTNDTNLDLFV